MKEKTCEVRYYQFNFYALLIICSIIIIPMSFILVSLEKWEEFITWFVFCMMITLPFLIYFRYRLNYYKKLKPTNIQEVKLEKVESSWGRLLRFSIQMEIDGVKKNVNTLAIFTVGYFGPNLVDDYSLKKALVGYDEKNDVAVVLKVLE